MPTNKNAIIRYRYLDELLSDRHHYYTRTELFEKCNERLVADGYQTVTKRAIEKDLIDLENDPFYMEIEESTLEGKKVLRYADQTQSIFTKPLSNDERQLLKEVLNTLGQFSGIEHFNWLDSLQKTLSDRKSLANRSFIGPQNKRKLISFSCNPDYVYTNMLGKLFSAIANEQTISVAYKKFGTEKEQVYTVFPYLLKQYNDRWYLLCGMPATDEFPYNPEFIMNMALDRIMSFEPVPTVPFVPCAVDLDERFDDIVGVTIRKDVAPVCLTIAVLASYADYIRTKPIHGSQMEPNAMGQELLHIEYPSLSDYTFFELKGIIPNDELLAVLRSFGSKLVVVNPTEIRNTLETEISRSLSLYNSLPR